MAAFVAVADNLLKRVGEKEKSSLIHANEKGRLLSPHDASMTGEEPGLFSKTESLRSRLCIGKRTPHPPGRRWKEEKKEMSTCRLLLGEKKRPVDSTRNIPRSKVVD